jgi:hypothetical protein
MRRSWLILLGGLSVAVAAYFGFYYGATVECRKLQKADSPELAWLKAEFHLNDADFTRVCRIHESYLAGCVERCRRIDEKNEQLRRLLASTNTVTPEIQKLLQEAAQLRAECQTQMLEEFYAVSRSMPPEQGKRYLAWVQGQTLLSDTHRQMQGSALSPMSMDMGASPH